MKYMNYKIRKVPRWRIDTSFERWLAHRADKNELWKRLYVFYYRVFDREYYEGGKRFIEEALQNCRAQGEKVDAATIRDMIYSHHRFGIAYNEYFPYGYPDKNIEGREKYVTDKMRFEYLEKLNRPENLEIFANKAKTFATFGKYYRRECLVVNSWEDKNSFIEFTSRHPRFMKKSLYGSGGREVEAVDLSDQNVEDYFKESIIGGGGYLLEELITNAPSFRAFHPCSLNTVRVVTLRTNSDPSLFYAFLRLGTGDSVVDNGGSGGILCGVDIETGIVYTCGVTEAGERYILHPDSKVQIVGFKIPRWHEACELALELSGIVPTNRYAAWDLALIDEGWVMIEGNDSGQFLIQFCDGVGIRKKLEMLIDEGREIDDNQG